MEQSEAMTSSCCWQQRTNPSLPQPSSFFIFVCLDPSYNICLFLPILASQTLKPPPCVGFSLLKKVNYLIHLLLLLEIPHNFLFELLHLLDWLGFAGRKNVGLPFPQLHDLHLLLEPLHLLLEPLHLLLEPLHLLPLLELLHLLDWLGFGGGIYKNVGPPPNSLRTPKPLCTGLLNTTERIRNHPTIRKQKSEN